MLPISASTIAGNHWLAKRPNSEGSVSCRAYSEDYHYHDTHLWSL